MISKLPQEDTIVAIATPPGEGGIGILRISGKDAPSALEKIWQGRRPVSDFQSHQLYFGYFFDPLTQEKLDEGLAVWMRAPHSYTGEETIEIQVHGGPFILNRLQDVLVQTGLRIAAPGEFTRRAFLNGKMDLLQAEAVGSMIHAQSEAALKNAQGQLAGRLSAEIGKLREQAVELLARIEAAIDFPEEDIEIIAADTSLAELAEIETILQTWLEKFQLGRLIREGVRLALIGRPNVGKSSLLNALLQEDRAIVHDSPGTTRDVVESWVEWDGIALQLYDTAGIREGEGPVEQAGIERSRKMAEVVDLKLWLVDASQPLTAEDRQILQNLSGPTLVIGNKSDLSPLQKNFPSEWSIPEGLHLGEWLMVSAKTGDGLGELRTRILTELGLHALPGQGESYLNNARHKSALMQAIAAVGQSRQALKSKLPAELVAMELREVLNSLGAIIGEVGVEEVLDQIFAKFCLGK